MTADKDNLAGRRCLSRENALRLFTSFLRNPHFFLDGRGESVLHRCLCDAFRKGGLHRKSLPARMCAGGAVPVSKAREFQFYSCTIPGDSASVVNTVV